MVTTSEDQLKIGVLTKNDTYILRYELSIDRLVVAGSGNININQQINGDFIDLP